MVGGLVSLGQFNVSRSDVVLVPAVVERDFLAGANALQRVEVFSFKIGIWLERMVQVTQPVLPADAVLGTVFFRNPQHVFAVTFGTRPAVTSNVLILFDRLLRKSAAPVDR